MPGSGWRNGFGQGLVCGCCNRDDTTSVGACRWPCLHNPAANCTGDLASFANVMARNFHFYQFFQPEWPPPHSQIRNLGLAARTSLAFNKLEKLCRPSGDGRHSAAEAWPHLRGAAVNRKSPTGQRENGPGPTISGGRPGPARINR